MVETKTQNRHLSMAIAATGTIIEWFDYSLFFYLATALSQTFYPNTPGSMFLVLLTGAAGFFFRPLGALVFGHIGDAYGRTIALVISTGLMALAMGGIAVMPGYATIGIWGGIFVLILRSLAGFSVGAEYTGIMVYLMESARPNRRGFTASLAAANSEVGALLAVGSAAVTTLLLGEHTFNEWGWRLPFALGAVLAAAMLPLRRYMVESPAMDTVDEQNNLGGEQDERSPLRFAFATQKRAMLVSFLISTVGSATYFLTITYLPTYIETVHSADTQEALNLGTIAALSAIVVTPFIGLLSDVIGRRWAFIATLIAVVTLAVPGYSFLASDSSMVVAVAVSVLAMPAAAWSAVAASAVPEQFAARGRYSGMALGYNIATVLFGGLTPAIVAWLIAATENPLSPAYYASIVTVLAGIPALVLMSDAVGARQASASKNS